MSRCAPINDSDFEALLCLRGAFEAKGVDVGLARRVARSPDSRRVVRVVARSSHFLR